MLKMDTDSHNANEIARAFDNMIEGQIRPSDVTDKSIIDAFRMVKKHDFIPSIGLAQAALCYADTDFKVTVKDQVRYMLSPVALAKMIKAMDVSSDDLVMVVGSLYGYSAAILSHLSNAVIGVENDKAVNDVANDLLNQSEIYNVALYEGDLRFGVQDQAPYNAILIEGAVSACPDSWLEQLADNGRLVVIEKKNDSVGRCVLYKKIKGHISTKVLFDLDAQILPNFEEVSHFAL